MKNQLTIIVLCIVMCLSACKQELLPALRKKQEFRYSTAFAPVKNYPNNLGGRNDDMSFLTHEKGWAINNRGALSSTMNGGDYWYTSFSKEGSYFRSLAFKDSLNGWLGTIGTGQDDWVTDSTALYETHDGGDTWSAVQFEGPKPNGICGLQVVSDQMIVGSGRVVGPSYFVRSTDGGNSWKSWDMNHIAGMLITPYFHDEKNGLLIGGTAPEENREESQGLILATEDGGDTWDTVYVTSQKNEWCWKVSFPTRQVGYVSVQRNDRKGNYYFLKTEDGGKTWVEKEYTKDHYFNQAIGFVNENIGWIGGDNGYHYETRDGGENWYPVPVMSFLNRIIFTGDSQGYASGSTIYELDEIPSLPDGKVITQYDNDQNKSINHYTEGKLNGHSTSYYKDGNLASKGSYVNNLKQGKWSYWDESGIETTRVYKNDIAPIRRKESGKYANIYTMPFGNETYYLHVKAEKGYINYRWHSWKKYRKMYETEPDHFVNIDAIGRSFKFKKSGKDVDTLEIWNNDRKLWTLSKLSADKVDSVAEELNFKMK